ncbi:MAG: pyridoxal phosphate-dependent aminotransferase [Hyphomicrobiales bacterium]|nr:pyridoxal phosphate-dependent aminotransferase [Hyphomicrobiales bacterium]MDE2017782.1 pyridoxal phosphate-dependent aminotransferase [Hyphomicrobiales bacterium]
MNAIMSGAPPRAAPAVSDLRPEAAGLPESGIVRVVNHGRGRQGLIPLWVGEGALPTPSFIRDEAVRSLAAGETFYTHQRGVPETREAITRYMTRHYGGAGSTGFAPDRFFVAAGGMHALQMALRMVLGPGDQAIIPTPAWPNFKGATLALGAEPVEVALDYAPSGWRLDFDRLAAAVTPRTRALLVNTPANPTGWTASFDDLRGLLALARRHGLWIVADEIYGRFVHEGERAPSFHDIADPDDRVMWIQTLSKNWAMTGLRVGWLEAPPAFGQTIENLVQYSTSGVPTPNQRAAAAALDHGEDFIAFQRARCAAARAILCEGLSRAGGFDFAPPPGAFYLFLRPHGVADCAATAIELVDYAGVGLAPGSAFGPGGDGFLRLCYARPAEEIEEAVRRLIAWSKAR